MDNTNPTPAGDAPVPQTEAQPTNTTTNTTPAPEAPQTGSSEATGTSTVDLHGLDPAQLGDIAKFISSNGGFDKLKSRLSNPQQNQPQQPEQSTHPAAEANQPQPQTQEQQPVQSNQPPKGYASLQEIQMQSFFKELSQDPKYANISEQIANGEVLKEMAKMGMHPIDENYNVNMNQLNDFLALKSASIPAKPTSAEPTNIPTVEYTTVENNNITSSQQAMQVLQESMAAERQGAAPHPAAQAARDFIKQHGL